MTRGYTTSALLTAALLGGAVLVTGCGYKGPLEMPGASPSGSPGKQRTLLRPQVDRAPAQPAAIITPPSGSQSSGAP